MTYLAVPIAGRNFEQATEQIKSAAATGAELLELRTDYLDDLDEGVAVGLIAEVRKLNRKLPVIVTCRDKKQGGANDYPTSFRVDVLITAIKQGVEFVDLEYENFVPTDNQERIRVALARSTKTQLILSAHNFTTRFADISRLYRDITSVCPGAIPKLVYTANHINDCFEALDLLHTTVGKRIVLCMGKAGLIVRLLAKKMGSLLTFASISDDAATAPGQLTLAHLKELYHHDQQDSDTLLYGVIANPVSHSLSPAIHNACFVDAKVNGLYLPLWVQGGEREFSLFINNVLQRKWLNFKGFSVTIPHKQNALKVVQDNHGYIEPIAEKIGAVNTLIITGDNKLKAYNTDYGGALDAITENMGISRKKLKGAPVAIIGAGGVARAIVAGLADIGAQLAIYNRTYGKAKALAEEFGGEAFPADGLEGLNAKLVINCTSIGMHPYIDESPVPQNCIEKGMTVFDTVYNPAETLLLKWAKMAGAKTIDGISMFVNQAMGQFKLFTGREGNAELMRQTVTEIL